MSENIAWDAAPTVYAVVIEGATIPIIDAVNKEEGFLAALEHRYHVARSTSRTMRMIDIAFMPALGPSHGLDASTTRIMIELRDDYDIVMRLLLWNGHRIDIVRHLYDVEASPMTGAPLRYSMGLLRKGETEWFWRRGLSSGQLFAATRWDDSTIMSLGRRTPQDLIDQGRNEQ